MAISLNSNRRLQDVLAVCGIIAACYTGWRVYMQFGHKVAATDLKLDFEISSDGGDYDITNLTKELYNLELSNGVFLSHIDYQGKTESSSRDDRAAKPLFQSAPADYNNSDNTSTLNLMRLLYDNYEIHTYVDEETNAGEEKEVSEFLNALLKTPIMQRTMKYLHSKDKVSSDEEAQFRLLKDIWFTRYSRGGGHVGSSGFEHVFLAELKDGAVLGLHNWIYFREQERKGHLDYKGYIKRVELNEHRRHYVAAIRFSFHNIEKSSNNLFIGTSPELEMSLYTVCFLMNKNLPCSVQLGNRNFSIFTHSWKWKSKELIAAAYPTIN